MSLSAPFGDRPLGGGEAPATQLLVPGEMGFAVLDWVTRTLLPAVMDAAGRADTAGRVAGLSPVVDRISADAALSMLRTLNADPWEDVSVPAPAGGWEEQLKRTVRWGRADRIVSRSILSDLGFDIDDGPDSRHVFRVMSGRLLWVRLAHSAGPGAMDWVSLWDESSRIYFSAFRLASGRVATAVYGRDPDSMIDPQLAIEAAFSDMRSTLQSGLRARFLLGRQQ